MSVLEFIQNSEFRKERARQLARLLVANVGIDGMQGAVNQIADDLIEVIREDIAGLAGQALRDAQSHAEALGFSELDAEAALATMQSALDRVLSAARDQLLARLDDLDSTVSRMLAATGQETVLASLASEATQEALLAPISAVLSAAAAGAVSAVETDIAAESVAAFHEDSVDSGEGVPLLEWQTREDDRVCEDVFENSCAPRHGRQLTVDEWQTFGEPGDPDAPTICAIFAKNPASSNCRCVLIPAGSAASTAEPINIAEAAARGRQLAKEAA